MSADFILTLRTQENGGKQHAKVHEELRPSGAEAWIIYIHGFRVSRSKALDQWQTLRRYLTIDDSASRVQCGIFLWPSDESFFYPKMVEPALQAGRKLAAYLRVHRRKTAETVLIGHSMGARVALQAAGTLAEDQIKLRGLVLLGAAVPVDHLGPAEVFERVHAKNEAVGHSVTDKALRKWFSRGERLYLPWREAGEAVGLRGDPESRTWDRWDSKSDDHSYWKFENSGRLAISALNSTSIAPEPAALSLADRSADERSPSCGS